MQASLHFASRCFRLQIWLVFTVLWSTSQSFTCLDFNGNKVDWYSVYKIPKIERSTTDWKLKAGLANYYLDVNTPNWTFSNRAINQSQQAVYDTLDALYKYQVGNYMYFMYNDEPPGTKSSGHGHTKGVVAFDKTSGFWLIHSVPHFPPKKSEGYSWPDTALTYGQTFLCVSFKYSELGNIATQLVYNHPNIYDKFVSDSIFQDFPHLQEAIAGSRPQGPPWFSVLQLTSLNNQQFTSFAKYTDFGADLYDSLVAPYLKEQLLVESWENGKGTALESNCTATYRVMRISDVSFPMNATFTETHDHSKWAVSFSIGLGKKMVSKFQDQGLWTCIGDINRMKSQFKRAGGTLCLQNSSLWNAYRNSVRSYNGCSI